MIGHNAEATRKRPERMNPQTPGLRWTALMSRLGRMFNLNDPRWGRGGDEKPAEGQDPEPKKPDNNNRPPQGNGGRGPNQGPPDLDELWRDFNRKLGGLFGGGRGRRPEPNGNFPPDMRSAGIGVGLIAAVLVLIWLGTGFFIVQEGQQAVIT